MKFLLVFLSLTTLSLGQDFGDLAESLDDVLSESLGEKNDNLVENQAPSPEANLTPTELQEKLDQIAPDLIDATIAVLMGMGSGSGVIVSPDGLCITAAHVTSEPGKSIKVLLSDGRELDAITLGVDHETDGALLKITSPGPFPYRPYIKTKTYNVGDWAIATGHPGGAIVGRPSPFRLGIITKAGTKSGFLDPISTSATVISGDSGGPLFNLKGEVIGINSNISVPSWQTNNHVPLPCIIDRWDELMDNATIGKPTNLNRDAENYFEEPYAKLRKKFKEALEKNADDPRAAELLSCPRLLDAPHMQALLDEWQPEENAPKTPTFGLILDPLKPTIIDIIKDSPADKSNLKKGDQITSANGQAINNTTDLALILKEGKPTLLTTNSGKSIELTPADSIARRHFPPPIAGLISMATQNDARGINKGVKPSSAFQAKLDPLLENFKSSVIPIKTPDGKTIAHATVIDSYPQLLTKASVIEENPSATAAYNGRNYPISILSTDEDHDLALIEIEAQGLQPVSWARRDPKTAQIILTPLPESINFGVVTQPVRHAPAAGYDHNHSSSKPAAFLGITLADDTEKPTIESIEVGSPADRIGLAKDDIIVTINKAEILSPTDISNIISQKTPGEKITVGILRDDNKLTFEPILAERPAPTADSFDRLSKQRDDALSSLSKNGGPLSKRRNDFPRAIYHDQILSPNQAGTPLINLDGKVVGLNIARALRHRSLAIPSKDLNQVVGKLRRDAED